MPASQLGPDDFPALVRLLDDVARDAGAGFTPTEVPAVEPVAPIAYPAHTPWTPPDDGGPCDPEAAARLRANARQLPADVQGTIKAWVSEADAAGRWHPGDTVRWFEVARAMSDAALFYCTEACDEDLLREWLWAATGDEACAQPGIRLGVIFGSLTIDQARTVATAMGDAYGGASPDYSTGVPRLAA